MLANPGSYVVPTWERKYPYDFGGLTVVDEADRERYLGSPIIILLASRDIEREGLDHPTELTHPTRTGLWKLGQTPSR